MSKSTRAPSAAAPLTSTEAFGIGLECIEWQLSERSLQVLVVNFRSGCGAEWQGKARVQDDAVALELRNSVCAIASCGNCLYDTATTVQLPAVRDVRVSLSLDVSCDGQPDLLEWVLPLTQQARGMSCRYAQVLGLGEQTGEPFVRCGAEGTCSAGYECTELNGMQPSRCLPACTADTDCPVPGGTVCEAGHCVPAAPVPFRGAD